MAAQQDAHNRRTFILAIIAIAVSGTLGLGNLLYQVHRDRSNKASAEVRFGKIETALRILAGATAPQLEKSVDDSLRSAVAEPTKTKEHLEFAGAVIQQLREANVSMSNAGVKDASQHLENLVETKHDIPQVWTTAGEFITYRSQMLTGWEQVNLPLCATQSPQSKIYRTDASKTKDAMDVTHGPFEYHYCKIILDSPPTTAALSPILQWSDVLLDHCVVFYNGGPIIIVPVKVGIDMPAGPPIGKIHFNSCTFLFSLPNIPDPDGQRLIKSLLASVGNNLEFGTS
jgi:hypothetical protein